MIKKNGIELISFIADNDVAKKEKQCDIMIENGIKISLSKKIFVFFSFYFTILI